MNKQTKNSPNPNISRSTLGRGRRLNPPTAVKLPSKTSKQTQNTPGNKAGL